MLLMMIRDFGIAGQKTSDFDPYGAKYQHCIPTKGLLPLHANYLLQGVQYFG